MCYLCLKNTDYSLSHLEAEIKKLRKFELELKAKEIKSAIKKLEIHKLAGHCDGFEVEMTEKEIFKLRAAQYAMSKLM